MKRQEKEKKGNEKKGKGNGKEKEKQSTANLPNTKPNTKHIFGPINFVRVLNLFEGGLLITSPHDPHMRRSAYSTMQKLCGVRQGKFRPQSSECMKACCSQQTHGFKIKIKMNMPDVTR